jgi:hypothetical protein
MPHAAPRSNDFGRRVREITEQPWLIETLGLPAVRTVAPVEKTIRG